MRILLNRDIIMKNKLLSILILFSFSCTDGNLSSNEDNTALETVDISENVAPPGDNVFHSVIANEASYMFSNPHLYTMRASNITYYNYERLVKDHLSSLKQIFGATVFNVPEFAHTFVYSVPTTNIIPSEVPGARQIFNIYQQRLIDPYFKGMYNQHIMSDASVAKLYNDTKYNIRASIYLNDADRILPLAIVESAHAFLLKYRAGGVSISLAALTPVVTNDCTVSFRSVWASAVIGGVSNGIRGALIGATGGTMTLPGLGTVGGAVGGGVFGFAAGFLAGAGGAVAEELLTSCLRKTKYSEPSDFCKKFENAFKQRCIDELPHRKLWFIDLT